MKTPKDLKEAKEIQIQLRQKIKLVPLGKEPKFIAGVDAAFCGDAVTAAACLYRYPELIPVEDAYAVTKTAFPYIPGYLSFREGPAIIKAVKKLRIKPDLILFDGQGTAHPEGMGIASHIGVLLDIPSIGCAKSRLVGDHREPGVKKGQHERLRYKNKTVGAVLRTKGEVRPLFVSPGHLTTLKEAVYYVLRCTGKFRIPEPVRRADRISKRLKNVLKLRKTHRI